MGPHPTVRLISIPELKSIGPPSNRPIDFDSGIEIHWAGGWGPLDFNSGIKINWPPISIPEMKSIGPHSAVQWISIPESRCAGSLGGPLELTSGLARRLADSRSRYRRGPTIFKSGPRCTNVAASCDVCAVLPWTAAPALVFVCRGPHPCMCFSCCFVNSCLSANSYDLCIVRFVCQRALVFFTLLSLTSVFGFRCVLSAFFIWFGFCLLHASFLLCPCPTSVFARLTSSPDQNGPDRFQMQLGRQLGLGLRPVWRAVPVVPSRGANEGRFQRRALQPRLQTNMRSCHHAFNGACGGVAVFLSNLHAWSNACGHETSAAENSSLGNVVRLALARKFSTPTTHRTAEQHALCAIILFSTALRANLRLKEISPGSSGKCRCKP